MRTDPFRELDRLTQQVLGTNARPAAMPMDAYRHGGSFYICLDLPGINPDSIDLTVEQNVLTVRAERAPVHADGAPSVPDRKITVFSWARGSGPGPGVVIGPGQGRCGLRACIRAWRSAEPAACRVQSHGGHDGPGSAGAKSPWR